MKRYLANVNDYTHMEILPLTDTVLYRTLAASTAERMSVPSGAKIVVLTAMGSPAYARGSVGSPDLDAALPSGDETVGNGSVPLPDGLARSFRCDDITSISLISSGTPVIAAEFYK